MLLRLASLALLVGFPSLAPAQTTTHLHEDFGNGAVDWFPVEYVQMWHITAPNECGAPAGWATSTLAQNPCRYGSPGWGWPSVLRSPEFEPHGGPLELSFRSRLEMDAGDSLSVRLMPPSTAGLPPLVLATEAELSNDGAIESITAFAPQADLYAGLTCHLRFDLLHDGIGDVGFGWMIDEVRLVETPVARPFCFGDGSGAACPCANYGGPGEGCAAHSGGGARLFGTGSARVAADDLFLHVAGGTASRAGVLFRGAEQAPVLFRDGLLCVGAPQVRIETWRLDASGAASNSAPLGSSSGAGPGDRHHYQLWYRSPSGACGTGSNLSSAVTIDWI